MLPIADVNQDGHARVVMELVQMAKVKDSNSLFHVRLDLYRVSTHTDSA